MVRAGKGVDALGAGQKHQLGVPPQEREECHPHLRRAEQKFQLFRGEKGNVCPGEQLPGDLPQGRFPFRLGPEGRLQTGHKAGQGPGIRCV